MWPELKVLGGIALRIGGWSLLGAAAVAAVYFLFLIPVYGKVWAAAPAYFFRRILCYGYCAAGGSGVADCSPQSQRFAADGGSVGKFLLRHARLPAGFATAGSSCY